MKKAIAPTNIYRLDRLGGELLLSEGESLRGANLSGADLRGVGLSNMDLRRVVLAAAEITGNISRCCFVGAKMQAASLGGWWEDCDFSGANLSRAEIAGHISRCNFFGACLNGAMVASERIIESCLICARLEGAFFKEVTFENCDFSRADLCGAIFRKCFFVDCDFEGAQYMNDSVFEDCWWLS